MIYVEYLVFCNCSFICQVIPGRRQQIGIFGLRAKLPFIHLIHSKIYSIIIKMKKVLQSK